MENVHVGKKFFSTYFSDFLLTQSILQNIYNLMSEQLKKKNLAHSWMIKIDRALPNLL